MSHRVTKLMQQDDRLNRLIEYLGDKEYDRNLFEDAINATGSFIGWEVDMWSIPLNKIIGIATRAVRLGLGNIFEIQCFVHLECNTCIQLRMVGASQYSSEIQSFIYSQKVRQFVSSLLSGAADL